MASVNTFAQLSARWAKHRPLRERRSRLTQNSEAPGIYNRQRNVPTFATLTELLQIAFGFSKFRPNQEAVCEAVTAGKDALLVMPTGSGKSLCYQLPGLARGGTTLVISPLIALMDDQVINSRREASPSSASIQAAIARHPAGSVPII